VGAAEDGTAQVVSLAATPRNALGQQQPSQTSALLTNIFCRMSQHTLGRTLSVLATARPSRIAIPSTVSPYTTMSTSIKFPANKASPIHWILDWDGTITKKDTLDALVNISAAANPGFPTQDRWNDVSKAYMDDYTATLSQVAPDGKLPTTVSGEKHLLAQMKPVEQRSLHRVSSSGIFAGLTKKAIEAGAKQAIDSRAVEVRSGFLGFSRHIRHDRVDDGLTLLSVNWSRHFIQSGSSTSKPEVASGSAHLSSSSSFYPKAPTSSLHFGYPTGHPINLVTPRVHTLAHTQLSVSVKRSSCSSSPSQYPSSVLELAKSCCTEPSPVCSARPCPFSIPRHWDALRIALVRTLTLWITPLRMLFACTF
jgi:hypothetical protein